MGGIQQVCLVCLLLERTPVLTPTLFFRFLDVVKGTAKMKVKDESDDPPPHSGDAPASAPIAPSSEPPPPAVASPSVELAPSSSASHEMPPSVATTTPTSTDNVSSPSQAVSPVTPAKYVLTWDYEANIWKLMIVPTAR